MPLLKPKPGTLRRCKRELGRSCVEACGAGESEAHVFETFGKEDNPGKKGSSKASSISSFPSFLILVLILILILILILPLPPTRPHDPRIPENFPGPGITTSGRHTYCYLLKRRWAKGPNLAFCKGDNDDILL